MSKKNTNNDEYELLQEVEYNRKPVSAAKRASSRSFFAKDVHLVYTRKDEAGKNVVENVRVDKVGDSKVPWEAIHVEGGISNHKKGDLRYPKYKKDDLVQIWCDHNKAWGDYRVSKRLAKDHETEKYERMPLYTVHPVLGDLSANEEISFVVGASHMRNEIWRADHLKTHGRDPKKRQYIKVEETSADKKSAGKKSADQESAGNKSKKKRKGNGKGRGNSRKRQRTGNKSAPKKGVVAASPKPKQKPKAKSPKTKKKTGKVKPTSETLSLKLKAMQEKARRDQAALLQRQKEEQKKLQAEIEEAKKAQEAEAKKAQEAKEIKELFSSADDESEEESQLGEKERTVLRVVQQCLKEEGGNDVLTDRLDNLLKVYRKLYRAGPIQGGLDPNPKE